MITCYRGKGDYHRLGHGTDDHVRRPRKVTALQGKKVISIATGITTIIRRLQVKIPIFSTCTIIEYLRKSETLLLYVLLLNDIFIN